MAPSSFRRTVRTGGTPLACSADPLAAPSSITGAAIVVLLGLALGASAVAVNAFGAGDKFDRLLAKIDRFVAGPPPDRPTVATVEVTDPGDTTTDPNEETDDGEADVPIPSPTPTPVPTPTPSLEPGETPAPTPKPTPKPPHASAVDFNIVKHPKQVFASEVNKDWCSPAGVQMALAVLGKVDTSDEVQATHQQQGPQVGELVGQSQRPLGARRDGAGAQGVRRARLRGPRLQVPRRRALRGAARAIKKTHSPASCSWPGAAPTPGS